MDAGCCVASADSAVFFAWKINQEAAAAVCGSFVTEPSAHCRRQLVGDGKADDTAAIQKALESDWGRLFANWEQLQPDAAGKGYPDVGATRPEFVRLGLKHMLEATRLLGMAVAESPELDSWKKRRWHVMR